MQLKVDAAHSFSLAVATAAHAHNRASTLAHTYAQTDARTKSHGAAPCFFSESY